MCGWWMNLQMYLVRQYLNVCLQMHPVPRAPIVISDVLEDLDLCAKISFVRLDSKLSCDLLLWYSKHFLNNAMPGSLWLGKNEITLLIFYCGESTTFHLRILLGGKNKSYAKSLPGWIGHLDSLLVCLDIVLILNSYKTRKETNLQHIIEILKMKSLAFLYLERHIWCTSGEVASQQSTTKFHSLK